MPRQPTLSVASNRNQGADHPATDLSRFRVGGYRAGPLWKVVLWYPINYYLFDTPIPWPSRLKVGILRLFGADIGKGVVIKPNVRIKNPWRLRMGNHSWIGESVWIDNMEDVVIGCHVNLSQGVILLTGNHDYTQSNFAFRLAKITLEDGVWIGARSVVCPGVTCRSHAVLSVNSVASKPLEPWTVYAGNPAVPVRPRVMSA
ncbi:colanic acid biosynthesis acetyltransferase WcaF [Hymenobacter sp. RP-2-7]|uniref:Colanic acid biosynthesis acetyltransferase WcaF n=2 Tax=Hymenobacter polaris TaxID=2682546 RepID=A0A7Y0ADC0_9BACT|nr:colanic acid biosynthesis acetyltransferase WcaF [Hymenobacter polaris]